MNDFHHRLAQLREQFLRHCSSDHPALLTAWSRRDRAELLQRAHSLAGRAGLFGFDDVGAAARKLESAIDADAPDGAVEGHLRGLVDALEEAGAGAKSR